MAGNLPDYSDYANYIGLDSACKMRWTGQWPQNISDISQTSGDKQAAGDKDSDHQQIMTIEHQLHQQLQQQLCVEQIQLLSQIQVNL